MGVAGIALTRRQHGGSSCHCGAVRKMTGAGSVPAVCSGRPCVCDTENRPLALPTGQVSQCWRSAAWTHHERNSLDANHAAAGPQSRAANVRLLLLS